MTPSVRALFLLVPCSLWGQSPLTLRQAVELAMRSNPLVAAADAREKETDAQVRQARSGYLPKLNFRESLQRSNNPVFVFGSLLTQHQFTAANFDLGPLNRPEALSNYQSQLTVEQVLFDAGRTRRSVEAMRFSREIAREGTRRNHSEIVLAAVRAYFALTLAARNLEVADQSFRSASADLAKATAVYRSGRSTQSEVLALRVHLAAVQEQQIRAANDLEIARATLNQALGVDLTQKFELVTPLEPGPSTDNTLDEYLSLARQERPEIREGELTQRLVQTQREMAQTAHWPQVIFQGVVEADRQRLLSRVGTNWLTAVSLRWNLWNGGETRAQIEQARFAEARTGALLKSTDSSIRLEVRKAYLEKRAAAQRLEVSAAAVAEAEEAHRIVRNRYEAGLTTVTELLRSETALSAARMRRLAAIYDHRVATAMLDYAAGILSVESPVVN